jgi:CBS domain containing-hemolysin-like protein
MGVHRELSSDQYYTPEELQFIVRESGAGGQMRSDAARLLDEIFEFGELRAGEAMVSRVNITGIPLGATPAELRSLLTKANHTRYPVYGADLDDIVGMVHTKDLLVLLSKGGTLESSVVRPVPFIPKTSTLDVVLQSMREQRTQMAIVIDEQGGTAGLLTIEDLFEEIVGEMSEQPGERSIVEELPGDARVEGTNRLDEAGDQLGIQLDNDDVDTVSGLVLMLLDRPPVEGDRVRSRTVEIEVRTVAGRGVGEAVIRRLPEDEPTNLPT